MKKKLIKRNKKKYSQLIREYGNLLSLRYSLQDDSYIIKHRHRYIETEDFKNAFKISDKSIWISVPISVSSLNKKSRVKNRVLSYVVVMGIEDFNKEYSTDLELSDIPVKIL